MKSFFNLNNPVWVFIGNISDFLFLSILWAICSLPIVTIGASTSALYYTTLKMTSGQDGYLFSSFWNSFKLNLKQGMSIWCIYLVLFSILGIDIFWSLQSGNSISLGLLLPFLVLLVIACFSARLVFILLARCDNTIKNLLLMSISLGIKNALPILSTIVVSIAVYMIGLFVFWPLLLIGPGLSAYINSFVFNHILNKYGFALID